MQDVSVSLHQDIPHRFDISVAIITPVVSNISTRVAIIAPSSCTKPNPGVTTVATVVVVPKNANPCFRPMWVNARISYNIKSFSVAIVL